MGKVKIKAKNKKRKFKDIPKVVLIVDNNRKSRKALCHFVRSQFRVRYKLLEANDAQEAFKKLHAVSKKNVAILAVDLALAIDDNIEPGLKLIQKMRYKFPDARILAYSLLPQSDVFRCRAIEAGASSYIHSNQVGDVMTQIFLENELHDLDRTNPLVNRVFNAMNMGISIQDVDMNILWVNKQSVAMTSVKNYNGESCWKCYHKFKNRSCACSDCVAWSVIEEAKKRIAEGNKELTVHREGSMLLPIKNDIEHVEVSAAPIYNSKNTEVLAVIEASRFTTKDWEKKSLPDKRLEEVIHTARKMTRCALGDRECISIAVYYQPKDVGDLYLFCRSAEPNVGPAQIFLPEKDLSSIYKQVLQSGRAQIVPAIRPGQEPSRFLWSQQCGKSKINVLIEVNFYGEKPKYLFTKDLKPYWHYVQMNFDEAHASRAQNLATTAHDTVQKFVAATKDIPDDDESSQASIIEKAINCIKQVLNPISAHIRTLDRKSNSLIKRSGFGTYFKVAPEKRMLSAPFGGSALVIAKREDIWETKPSLENIRNSIDTELKAEDISKLEKISGYALLPLVFGERVLGTLNVQFGDDSLFSQTKKSFLKMLASALSSELGRRAVIQEHKEMVAHFRTLDQMMFGDGTQLNPEEQERDVVREVTQMLFGLTYAELVVYYRYDPITNLLRFVEESTCGQIPPKMKLPAVIPVGLGVIGMVAKEGYTEHVNDYKSKKWAEVRTRLIQSLKELSEKAFCEWISCEAVSPLIIDKKLEGVFVAVSPIADWITSEDFSTIDEFVFKTGLCLKAMRVKRQLLRDLEVMESLKKMAIVMGQSPDMDALHRLFLLMLTIGETLKFSRAIMFIRSDKEDGIFKAVYAVGSITREFAEVHWKEADGISLEDKVKACYRWPEAPKEGNLFGCIDGLSIKLGEEQILAKAFAEGTLAHRYQGQPHIVTNSRLIALLTPPDAGDIEYVFAPLRMKGGNISGIVVVDRAFLPRSTILPEELTLIQLACNEYMLMSEALEVRRKVEESTKRLAWGVTYTLRTRAAALEAHLFRLKQEVGDKGPKSLAGMEAAVRFFKRTGTIASKSVWAQNLSFPLKQTVDLNQAISETIQIVDDPRISLHLPDTVLRVLGNKGAIQDIILELLANSRDFVDAETGNISVYVSESDTKVQLDIQDNGPGISPEIREHLFEMFNCSSPARMGLGLAYARTVARVCGGDIVEVGQFGNGVHFIVTLLLAKENKI